ncbi:polyunsaturated fatty acid lipoxygenase ALOX15B-like [Pholidichthys leucotaenia]
MSFIQRNFFTRTLPFLIRGKLKRSSNIADLASLMAQNHPEEMWIRERMLKQRERHLQEAQEQEAALRRDELTETASFHGAFLNPFGSKLKRSSNIADLASPMAQNHPEEMGLDLDWPLYNINYLDPGELMEQRHVLRVKRPSRKKPEHRIPLLPGQKMTEYQVDEKEAIKHEVTRNEETKNEVTRNDEAEYEVTVFTGGQLWASTWNNVHLTLQGENGKSEPTVIRGWFLSPLYGQKYTMTVSCTKTLGKLLWVKLYKPSWLMLGDSWYPEKIEVKTPDDITYIFPIYHWIVNTSEHHFMEGSATIQPSSEKIITWELDARRVEYKWDVYEKGIPHCMKAPKHSSLLYALPHDARFSFTKFVELAKTKLRTSTDLNFAALTESTKDAVPHDARFSFTKFVELAKTKLRTPTDLSFAALTKSTKDALLHGARFSFTKFVELAKTKLRTPTDLKAALKWESLDDIRDRLRVKQSRVTEYVKQHWKEDAFFGYQYLNGTNPILIRRCRTLPDNFPVSEACLGVVVSLEEEMTKGNIFLCDYKNLDGVPTNTIDGKQQYMAAPLVLLWKNFKDELVPVAIQLRQEPAKHNPIFYPSDSEHDWLLAKIFVRSADFNEFQLNAHLLRTHLLAEVFTVAVMRNFNREHPMYKLLVPHTHFTLQINYLARQSLISKDGVFTKFAASGGEGVMKILKRSLKSVTYRSLCIPDDIKDRGLSDVPNYYYRDDGLKLWEIIYRFVEKILGCYYKDDRMVMQDTKLQDWIQDIFEHGFPDCKKSGIPQEFTTLDEVVKFVTMVIFTCSAQHSAVNTGQYDFCGWMPNAPVSLQQPPPTKKGTATEKMIVDTLPSVNTTAQGLATIYVLSKPSTEDVRLGEYPWDYFTEKFPCMAIKQFQVELKKQSIEIEERNLKLDLPYTYLDPEVVTNSVTI